MTLVASHPATVAEVRDDPAVAAEVAAWEGRVVAWLRDTWGDDLACVVRHVDEKHAHLHAFIVSGDAEMRARRLHPGVAAKEAAKLRAVAEGADAKAANAMGDKAYRAAMRAMQEGFWRSVGIPYGLARIGPARRRLTRAEWHSEKAGVAAAAVALQVADVARVEADAARLDAATVTGAAVAQRTAAESLQARAEVAAARARAVITAARGQAAEAKAAADMAEAARAEAERQARMLALVHGPRGMAPAAVAREAASVARAEEQAVAAGRAAMSRIESERTQKALRLAETRLASVSEAAAGLGAQRDRLARELDRLRPGPSTGTAPTPRLG
jgi:hypothetical protein